MIKKKVPAWVKRAVKKCDDEEKAILKENKEIRRKYYKGNDKGWIKWLEAMYVNAMLNWSLSIESKKHAKKK